MKFTKMHGNGNDYIYINCFEESIEGIDIPNLTKFLSNRHFGVGSDGVILIRPSESADCFMDMYNSDGSRGNMCGNALRCVGKYLYDKGLVKKTVLRVETLSGMKSIELTIKDGICQQIKANIGEPIFDAQKIPLARHISGDFIEQPIYVNEETFRISCVSLGAPHAVIFANDIDSLNLEQIGPPFENHPIFPDRINVNFVQVTNSTTIKSRTWERGSGETLACGTGASASIVISALLGKCDYKGTAMQRGGNLLIEWDKASNQIYMSGPATFVFDGFLGETFLKKSFPKPLQKTLS